MSNCFLFPVDDIVVMSSGNKIGNIVSVVPNVAPSWAPATSLRNLVINGAMEVHQRATASAQSDGLYVCDRWKLLNIGATGLITMTRNSGISPPLEGYINTFARGSVLSVPTSTEVRAIEQQIEGSYFVQAGWTGTSKKTLTLQFWVQSSRPGTYNVQLTNASESLYWVNTYTIATANVWEKKTMVISPPAGAWSVGASTDAWLKLRFVSFVGSSFQFSGPFATWLASSINYGSTASTPLQIGDTFDITGVHLEVASQARPYEYRPYFMELDLCKRYCAAFDIPVGIALSTSALYYGSIQLYNRMRVPPTLFDIGTGVLPRFRNNTGALTRVLTLQTSTNCSVGLLAFNSDLVAGEPYQAVFVLEAEL